MAEKQKPLTHEQQVSVDGALKALKKDIGDPEAMKGLNTLQELRSLLAALQNEKDAQSVLTKEKRDTLRAAIQQKKTDMLASSPDAFKEGTEIIDELSQGVDRDLNALEERLVAAEKAAAQSAATPTPEAASGDKPQLVADAEQKAKGAWNTFRSFKLSKEKDGKKATSVGDILDWIGGMTGKTLKSSADLWAWVKGAVLGAIANGDFTKNPKIMEWAKMKLNEEAVVEGIQFSVTKAKKGQIVTENPATKTMEPRPIKARFDPVYSADDIRAWTDVLIAGKWCDTLDAKAATAYVDQYIKEKAPKETNEMVITVDMLVKANLVKPIQAKTVEENKKVAGGEKPKDEKKTDEKKESEQKA